jgi:general nucleoside transport system permease protein
MKNLKSEQENGMTMTKIRQLLVKNETVFTSILAVLLSFFVIGLILLSSGRNPIEAFYYFFRGAFGTVANSADTLTRITPLLISAIGFMIGAKCGVFNVGIEGQLLLGSMAAAIVGYAIRLPRIIHLPLVLLVGALAGGIYALFPAWLKVYRGVNEILSTIMLNYPAFFFTRYLTNKVLPIEGVVPATPFIEDTARLTRLLPGTRLHTGIFIAIIFVFLAYFLMQKTSLGYEMRAVGKNKKAARFHGIHVEKRMMLSFFLRGAMAGLAGAVEITGVHFRYLDQFSPGYGFDAITVALVGLLNPFGVMISSVLFGALKTGILDMAVYTAIPRQLVTLINGIVVLFIAAKSMIRSGFLKAVLGKAKLDDIGAVIADADPSILDVKE